MRPLIILTGPTAVGKTGASIGLAKAIGGEIISADSMQVYQKMNIGTAKITPQEMEGVPHYLVDEIDPGEEFNVVEFKNRARAAVEEIYSHGHIPIIVGGTGFYIQALLYDVDFSDHDEGEEYREQLRKLAEEKGPEYLHEMLEKVDPAYAASVHANNVKRVIRALEYHHETGGKLSEHNETQRERTSPYDFVYFVLTMDREKLYDRIEKRIEMMLDDGLVDEVRALKEEGYTRDMVSMQGLGYKEILDYLDGRMTLSEAVTLLKRDTRRFAKRQLTWFRREKDVTWVDKDAFASEDALLTHLIECIDFI